MSQTYDEWLEEQQLKGQGNQPVEGNQNRRRGERKKKEDNGGSDNGGDSGGNSGSNNGESSDTDPRISAAMTLSKTLAEQSGARIKYQGKQVQGKKVSSNDEGLNSSMDITTFSNAHGTRNKSNTGPDMKDFNVQDLQLTPAEKRKLKQYNSYNVG